MGVLGQVRPWFLGLACCHVWIYCVTHRFSLSDDVSVMAVMYAALSAVLVALFAALRRLTRLGRDGGFPAPGLGRALDLAAAACMAASSALLVAPPAAVVASAVLADAAVVSGSALGGVGVAWAYMRWGQLYARLDIRLAAPLVFVTMAAGSVAKAVVDLLPALPAAALLVVVPFLGALCVCRSLDGVPAAPEPARLYYGRTLGSLVRLALGIAAYSLTVGVIQSMMLETSVIPAASVLVHHGSEVLLGLGMAVWVTSLGRGLNFCRTWRIILVLMGTALIFQQHIGADEATYLLSLIRTAQTFLIVFLFLGLADVARHSPYNPMAVFSLGWCAYTLPFMAGKLAGDWLLAATPDAGFVSSVILWVLVAVMLFVLDEGSVGNRLIFTELADGGEDDTLASRVASVQRELNDHAASSGQAGRGADVLALRCEAVAARYGLTPREQEILSLLVRGRSKAHIAEAFLISENTVRGHVKHIYAKLEVHGKQELLDKVDAIEA